MAQSSPISSLVAVVVFVNPTAGGGRARFWVPRVRKVLDAASVQAEFISTENSKELESGALAAINNGKRLLLALGGDGTFQGLVNAAYGADVVVGVLPAGGGNDFAAALGLPEDPVAAAELLLRGQLRPMDLVRARTADGRERFYVGGGGVGIDAEAARHASGALRHLPGRSRYVAAALRALCGYHAIGVRVEFPESDLPTVEVRALLVAYSIPRLMARGSGLRPTRLRMMDGSMR